MKNNTAILNCETKIIKFKYLNEEFTVDLKEGDIQDSWNTITDKNGVMWDVNFSWEDEKGEKPSFAVYGLKKNGKGELNIDYNKETSIKIGKSDRNIYFKEDRFKYVFNPLLPLVFTVFDENDELVLKTKRGNKASDTKSNLTINGGKPYMIVTDSNGATKRLD